MNLKFLFHFLFVLVMTCPVMGQVAKKPLTEADYKLWSSMDSQQLSDAGNWVSYAVHYESGRDTLFVRQTKNLKTYAFAGGSDGHFATDSFFVNRGTDGGVILTNLRSGRQIMYHDISSYRIARSGTILILQKNVGTVSGDLLLVGTDGKSLLTLPKVGTFSLDPSGDTLVCDSERKLLLVDLNHLQSELIVGATETDYQQFAWQPNGASFTYLTDGIGSTIGYYRINEKKLYTFDKNQFVDFPKEAALYCVSGAELSVSEDGTRIFFGIKEKELELPNNGVQVWNAADKMLYPWRAAVKNWNVRPKLAVWFPKQQQFRMVTDAEFPYQQLLPRQQTALVYNPLTNEPQFDYEAPIDYYLQDIETGRQKLFLPKFSAEPDRIKVSQSGNHIAYFKDNQWLLYDTATGAHIDLTSKTGKSFIDEKYDRSGEHKVSGFAGWTADDKELLVYDTYDIWLLKTDGTTAVRLTKGREEKIVYRVVRSSAVTEVLDLTKGLLLVATAPQKSGYFTWDTKRGLTQLVWEENRITGLIRSATDDVYCFTREHYHLSPELVLQFKDKKKKVVYQSNPQQKKYLWGFSKLISYENSKGQALNGALFYPSGFDADKSYPMVVYIYERVSDGYNQYVNPSLLNQDGFNISNLTAQGYFVLLPDIIYTEGEPGKSALNCVTAAVNEVLAHESVDPNRLGLYGHSFGGYEVNFIVTHSTMFATVISSSGMSDHISNYLSVCRNNMKPNGWRYEFNQSRMGISLFDGLQKYLDDSPILFANQVQTPVLLWSGDSDRQVNYNQSLEFHLALRRLQKPNIFLLYEGENHAIMRKENQLDLTHRTQEWFDYYLKGARKPEWFSPDRL